MALLETPACAMGTSAPAFQLTDVFGKAHTLDSARGPKGLLVVFMCNHCPYVQRILPDLVPALKEVQSYGIGVIAISANDANRYPQDAPEHMQTLATEQHFSFPYCYDETQAVAHAYGAVCTPDFFGYNAELELQYRGCFRHPVTKEISLLTAMNEIAQTGMVSFEQYPSMGCSIKWRD
ncbi:MAG: thioredoxin family protein [Pseudomonadota bacterium]